MHRHRACVIVVCLGLAGALMGCRGESSLGGPDAPLGNEAALINRASELAREAQRLELDGEPKEAIVKYQEAIGAYRELPVAWNNMGRLLMKEGENLQAADAFKTASELSPTDPRPMYNLGALWEDLGYMDDAQKWYDQAIDRDGNYLPALRRRVLIDQLRDRADGRTFQFIRRALLLEKDPWWIDRLKRAENRLRLHDNPDGTRVSETMVP